MFYDIKSDDDIDRLICQRKMCSGRPNEAAVLRMRQIADERASHFQYRGKEIGADIIATFFRNYLAQAARSTSNIQNSLPSKVDLCPRTECVDQIEVPRQ